MTPKQLRQELEAANEQIARLTMPPEVRLALRVILNHTNPLWVNCKQTVRAWLDSVEQFDKNFQLGNRKEGNT